MVGHVELQKGLREDVAPGRKPCWVRNPRDALCVQG